MMFIHMSSVYSCTAVQLWILSLQEGGEEMSVRVCVCVMSFCKIVSRGV